VPKIELIQGDCLEKMKDMPDESVDAIVTDPPYELGFMGKKWDASGIAYNVDLWQECLRVLKPGGHLLAFGGTRTYHRMAVAIEDAGFEVRDMLEWIYFSGFPKSLNVSKAIEKQKGVKPIGIKPAYGAIASRELIEQRGWNNINNAIEMPSTQTKEGKQWEGFGTALKPAHEPIILARRPLECKTIVENILKHGTGAIDIDGCRIPLNKYDIEEYIPNRCGWKSGIEYKQPPDNTNTKGAVDFMYGNKQSIQVIKPEGRFPANIICTDDALNDGVMTKSGARTKDYSVKNKSNSLGVFHKMTSRCDSDSGSKSRYFDIEQWWKKLIDTSSTLLLSGLQDVAVCSGLLNNNAYIYSEYDAEQLLRNADKVWGSVASYNSLRTYLLSNEGLCVQSLKALQDFLGDYPNNPRCGDELSRLCEGISPEFSQLLNDVHTQVQISLHSGGLDNIFGCSVHQKPYSVLLMLIILPNIIKVREEVKQKNTFNQEVWAEKHGLLQFPKASKSERNEGCEGLEEKDKIRFGSGGRTQINGEWIETHSERKPFKNHHPTVKPVHLMAWLVRLVSKEGDTVLDPFVGSGTTGVACVNLNRNFIGIELDPEYFKIAEKRIGKSIKSPKHQCNLFQS